MSHLKDKNYQRTHLRAPLKTFALYSDEGYVFKAQLMNISEGGLLIQQLPHFPSHEDISVMIAIPHFPDFSKMERVEIFKQRFDSLEKRIVRLTIKTIRRTQSTTSVDQVFQVGIGGKFLELDLQIKNEITSYVNTFTKNLVYLLNLLEVNANAADKVDLIKHLALLFGYEPKISLAQIHRKVRHDYQSLEWL